MPGPIQSFTTGVAKPKPAGAKLWLQTARDNVEKYHALPEFLPQFHAVLRLLGAEMQRLQIEADAPHATVRVSILPHNTTQAKM